MGLIDGKCDVCENKLTRYFQDEKGKCYCSEKCYQTTWHKCSVCRKPMKEWTETEDGNKYCSEECYQTTWHKCSVCIKPMKEWTETEDGNKYCSEACFEASLDTCRTCNKPLREWILSEGEKFCSDNCFLESCPSCAVCGNHTDSWIESDKNLIFCSDNCRNTTLPTCNICAKRMETWLVSKDNTTYCSEECYSHTLPRCMHCCRAMNEWLVTEDGRVYCSDTCISENNIIMEKVYFFCNLTGLTTNEVERLLIKNGWSLDDAILKVDNYMQSLDGKVTTSIVVIEGIKNAGIYDKLAKNLSSYNTLRGGSAGFKGFVFEEMHAANATLKGKATEVIANNGLADFRILNPDGTYSFGQAKVGYNSGTIDWSAYKGQEIVIDKGNTKLIESARKAGMKVVESDISGQDAQSLAKTMQFESKISGKSNAPITANLHSYHQAGINSAKSGAAFGAGFSIGSNIVDVATGDSSVGEASATIAKDTATAAVTSYVVGAGTTALANTTIGGAVISGATAAGAALAGTSVGAATIAAGIAVSGAATVVGGAIASTAVGATVIGGATAAATVLGTTAIGATIVAAAPLVAAGAVIGGIFKIGKKVFGRR